jgi:hypothetical protein
VTGNTLVWRQFSFAPLTTSRIRVLVTRALSPWSILTEVEAWETAPAALNSVTKSSTTFRARQPSLTRRQ